MLLSVIIPVYNEEKNIHSLYERLSKALHGINAEYVFINDGSKDKSYELIRQLQLQHTTVKYIDFSRNFGHQTAVMAGLDYCRGDVAVIIDADLQDPPELIPEFLNKLSEGFDVVYARRRKREGETFLKKWTAKSFYRLLAKITSVNIPVDTGDFRAITRRVIDVLKKMPEKEKYLRGQIAWVGFRQTYIEYDRDSRAGGETGYTYRKMINFALDGITSFSNFPLRLATIMGFVVSGITFLLALFALYARFISRNYVPGWTSIILSILFLGGVQLICIGIIGEYISRISANVRNRPLYVVRETNYSGELISEPREEL